MNKQFVFAALILSTTSLVLSSCQKNIDVDNRKDELPSTPLPGQQTYCRIESVWENPRTSGQRFILFLYDEYENPTAITTPGITSDGPYHTFRYDSWHRLREYKGDEGNSNFEFDHFYGYDLNGRINVDTNYTLGGVDRNGHFYYNSRWIYQIQYDNQNRIIKTVTDVVPVNTHFETTYNYDAAGNLVHSPSDGVTYDNKVNIFRTNDIWMFLNRDYSVNNPVVANEYNPSGFPTKINSTFDFRFLNAAKLSNSQISYGCRQAYW